MWKTKLRQRANEYYRGLAITPISGHNATLQAEAYGLAWRVIEPQYDYAQMVCQDLSDSQPVER